MKLLDLVPWPMGLSWTAPGAGSPHGFRLSSHFQAIFGTAERRPVGYEALIRATRADGIAIEPADVLRSVPEGPARAGLDRQCRRVQVERFTRLGDAQSRLFLNLDPQVLVDGPRFGAFFAEVLEAHGLPAERVAVELTELPLPGEQRLAEAIRFYRDLGCLVVVDDFGAGHSNFDRVWRIEPDIVKIDREMTRRLSTNAVARRTLAGLVSLLHEAGAMVCIEGIETEDQALCAIDSGAELLQGFYFARPAETLVAEGACRDVFDHLRDAEARRRNDPATAASVRRLVPRRARRVTRRARPTADVIRFRRRLPVPEGA